MRPTLWAMIALALVVRLPAAGIAEEAVRPNFVIMIADDVGWDDVGCYGNPGVRTPRIDALAKQGMRFDQAFLTCSSCSPSRCSIMTGRYPHATGAAELHQPLPASQVVFAGLLKKAGYHTAAAGKWHLGKPAEVNFDRILPPGGPSGCENWVKALKDRPRDRPFFLWLAAVDAHRPYSPGAATPATRPGDVRVPPYLPDAKETRGDLALYYDEITRLDGHVGKVLDELAEQAVADNTIVIFMSDNGRPFPRCKTTVYDSGVRTPFLVRWPSKVKPGSACDRLISSIDIAPTFTELAALPPSPTFQGESFAPLLRDPQQRTREAIYAEHNWHDYQAHERAVRTDRYLYIRNAFPNLTGSPPADAVRSPTYLLMQELHRADRLTRDQLGCFLSPRPTEELYDVKADPHQLHNLMDDPTHAQARDRLRGMLDQWVRETGDRVPEKPTPDRFDRVTGKPLATKSN